VSGLRPGSAVAHAHGTKPAHHGECAPARSSSRREEPEETTARRDPECLLFDDPPWDEAFASWSGSLGVFCR